MPIFDLTLDELRRRSSIKWVRFEPDVLPMFVAEMDCAIAPAVKRRLQRALRDSDTGYPELPLYQEAFAGFASDMWGWTLDPLADMSIAGDVMSAMRELVLVVTEPGDPVVINTPVYPPFRNTVSMTGRTLVASPVTDEGRLDLEGLEAIFSGSEGRRPGAFLLCSPHNPHGTRHTRDELARVARMAAEYDVTVISDEIHAPLEGRAHIPFTTLPGAEKSFVVTSASKSWNLAGMKAGLIIAGPDAHAQMRRLPGIVAESASWFGVLAHATALEDGREWLAEVTREIVANKEHLARELQSQLGLTYTPSEATYLAWVDCSQFGLEDPTDHFHKVGRVRFNPGTAFDPAAVQFVRINAGTSPELITEGVRRMASSLPA